MSGTTRPIDNLKAKTCCVAGHKDIPADQTKYVRAALEREVRAAIADGYIYFQTDFMVGVDQLFAEVVRDISENENGAIRLVGMLPYRNYHQKLFEDERSRALLLASKEIGFSNEDYVRNCHTVCRRKMLRDSSRMIVVYDGRGNGGTAAAIRLAHAQEVPIREIPLGR